MKLFEVYESVLQESSGQACFNAFGKELFGDQLGGSEGNTRVEDKYADIIAAFTDNEYGEELGDEFMSAVERLYGCISVYPEVLIPDNTMAYRGTSIPVGYFIDNRIPIPTTDTTIPYTYRASSPIQSWSTSEVVAQRFGTHDVANELSYMLDDEEDLSDVFLRDIWDSDLRIPFVMRYQTTHDEFMFRASALNALSQHGNEDEILRIDNRPIKLVAAFNNSAASGFNRDVSRLYTFINSNMR